MKRQDFRFLHRLRVRWSEVDMQKIVFNAHYLMYFDVAITDYWRALALPYEDTMPALGGELYVKKATVEFHASARLDDQLDVGMRCSRLGRSSMVMSGGIFRGEQGLISGELIYVFADPATQTASPLPEPLRALIQGFEAGEPVCQVRSGGWDVCGADARALRQAVFVQEQGIDPADEWDPADAHAWHAVVYNRLGLAIATGRLLPSVDGTSTLGRMAVHRVLRGSGLGHRVAVALIEAARQRGDHTLRLSAQQAAQGFYQRLGFEEVGEPYEAVGIPHIEMQMRL
jgi:YbgC/YbaW family acyl-CoA thioester hydrolase